ncbi:MAG: AzlC family ABC transporter permease [Bdellovibrionaceae bacterium]|nr:AzlC family ABC transporter permease [Pseudobdellovibrionaceae bacterium]
MKPNEYFYQGFRSMLPVTTGAIPFGAVVGTMCAEAKLTFAQAITMDHLLYAGAAQLASVELMSQKAAALVVVASGLIINLRFLLYSAAMSPLLQNSRTITKVACAYLVTDQSYAAMSAHQDKLKTPADSIQFYFGTAVCMLIAWHASLMAGYAFGNFAPTTWALDYAVPLSFLALVLPTLKNRNYIAVALFSSVVSVLLYQLPYKLGLIVTALLAIGFGAFLTRKKDPR